MYLENQMSVTLKAPLIRRRPLSSISTSLASSRHRPRSKGRRRRRFC
nr:MAG TPA: hypothetical protein [Microviridae sp.]